MKYLMLLFCGLCWLGNGNLVAQPAPNLSNEIGLLRQQEVISPFVYQNLQTLIVQGQIETPADLFCQMLTLRRFESYLQFFPAQTPKAEIDQFRQVIAQMILSEKNASLYYCQDTVIREAHESDFRPISFVPSDKPISRKLKKEIKQYIRLKRDTLWRDIRAFEAAKLISSRRARTIKKHFRKADTPWAFTQDSLLRYCVNQLKGRDGQVVIITQAPKEGMLLFGRTHFDRFHDTMSYRFKTLSQKYQFQSIYVDSETIYDSTDLTEVVQLVLDSLAKLPYEVLLEEEEIEAHRFHTQIRVGEQEYDFYTSNQTDYIEMDKVFPVWEQLFQTHLPGKQLCIPHYPYDQLYCLVAGDSGKLFQAIREGFPLTGADIRDWDFTQALTPGWKKLAWTSDQLLNFQEMENLLLDALQELGKRGFTVPALTPPRIYVTDMFDDQEYDLCLDGNSLGPSIDIQGQTLTFWRDPYSLSILWYMSKEQDTPITLHFFDESTQTLSPQEFESLFFAALPRK